VPNIIISDIDGTLLASGDNLIQKTWDYIESLEGALFIVTGRPDSERTKTEADLEGAGVTYSRLIMNPGSTADSVAFKKATAEELLKTYDVVAAIENNPDALRAYNSLGITAIDPADIPDTEQLTEDRAAVDSLEPGDYVSWNVFDPEILAEVEMTKGQMAVLKLYEEEDGVFSATDKFLIMNVLKLEKVQRPEMVAEKFEEIETDQPEENPMLGRAQALIARIEAKTESEPMTDLVMDEARAKWLKVAYGIKAKLEGVEGRSLGKGEVRTNHIELRAEGDGRTFTGYASVFNEPSLPLPFTEIVKPGAFKRSLQSRNRMMLLWNHDTSNPLASTRNGSLQLAEDARGLKVTATLPDTTLGRDIAELVRTGVIDAMSFGFAVKKDSWSQDGNTRYLEDVSLYEVSLVSTPAYEQTSGTVSVRSVSISADALADALLKIESGDELTADDSALMRDVIDRLAGAKVETDGDLTALYKKKLALAEIGN
jgi:HK97 family phage prohead protease